MVGLEEEEEEEQLDGREVGQQLRSETGTLAEEGQGKRVNVLALRLRSGDVVYMSGKSRFAWHGVPKVIPGTCPEWMQEWPAGDRDVDVDCSSGEFEAWRGWMASKRINLNVRQMWE
jgi:hypothetical protein